LNTSEIGKLGLYCITDPYSYTECIKLAHKVERLGYGAIWIPEAYGRDSFVMLSVLAGETDQLGLATGIANIYARDPMATKAIWKTVSELAPNRFILGLGVSHQHLVQGQRGHDYGKPVATMRAYLAAMDEASAMAPQLDETPPTVIAALGPNMTALGAKIAAGIHPYNVVPAHTAWAREIVGPEPWVCVEQKVMLITDADLARKVAREGMTRYMALPNYRNNWLRQGFSDVELDNGSDRFLDAMVPWGDADAIKAVIQAHFDAGASHVCIQPFNPDGSALPHMAALEALAP